MEDMEIMDFYKGKKVLVTGHTGFKGTWLCKMLVMAGAEVTGYALEAPTDPSLYEISKVDGQINSVIGDIRDFELLKKTFDEAKPEIVIHMAAQPLVRDSYIEPRYTYETNVMGTVNLLECVRLCDCVKSVVNVTTDKVYENIETNRGYVEDDKLDGYDPYSNSKSCSELVTHSYKKSFLDEMGIAVSTARAGNVIGGGDFAVNRIVPDCFRAAAKGEEIIIRNPHSVRPFQLVLEPLFAYLLIAKSQYEDITKAGYYNVGPDDNDCITVGELTDIFCEEWGDGMKWVNKSDGGPHEAGLLRLDASKIKRELGWKPRYDIKKAIAESVEFYKGYAMGTDIVKIMEKQIDEFRS